jgi:release factor glutamine methyltransferase
VTVIEAIQKSADFLSKKNVGSPRLQTELLLAHLLKMPRMKLYLNFDRALTIVETDAMREFIKRRAAREPLQHIVGSTSFCGHEILVNKNVLVPRPETEMLAELGWQWLEKPRTSNIEHPTSNFPGAALLDFCTGSGCIAIVIATKCPNAKIVATDVSADALALAKENAAKNKVAERIEFLQGNGFAALPTGAQFDLIVSNPPYIASAEIETLDPEVRDFDPHLALDGGVDGLDFYRKIAAGAKSFLKPDGKLMLEFGDGQADAIKKIFEDEKWIVEAVKDDYSQRARILIASLNG